MPKQLPPGFENVEFPTESHNNPFGPTSTRIDPAPTPEIPQAGKGQKYAVVSKKFVAASWPSRSAQDLRRKADARVGAVKPSIKSSKPIPGRHRPKLKWPLVVSQTSDDYLEKELTEGTLTQEEIPAVFEIAILSAATHRRSAPTLSDIQIGVTFKTLDRLASFASGALVMDVTKFNIGKPQQISPKEMLRHWINVAKTILAMKAKKDQEDAAGEK